MPRRIPDYPDAFYIFNKIATWGSYISGFSVLIFFFTFYSAFNLFNAVVPVYFKIEKRVLTFLFNSQIFFSIFPVLWNKILIDNKMLFFLSLTSGFQLVVYRSPVLLVFLLITIVFVVLMSIVITNIYYFNKTLFFALDKKFLNNNKYSGKVYWEFFKKIYFYNKGNLPKPVSTDKNKRSYVTSTVTKTTGSKIVVATAQNMYRAAKHQLGQGLVEIGSSMAKQGGTAKAAAAQSSASAATTSITIGSQGVSATTQVAGGAAIAGGLMVATGADQIARHELGYRYNVFQDPNYQRTPLEMKPPFGGGK